MSTQNSDSDSDFDEFCPALPPHLLNNPKDKAAKRSQTIGPTLPQNYKLYKSDFEIITDGNSSNNNENIDNDSENEEEMFGPLPANLDEQRFNNPEMELRMKTMIEGVSQKDNLKQTREAWMLELPTDKPNIAALGLGKREFRKKNPQETGDRSAWTDTPDDKIRKQMTSCSKKPEQNATDLEKLANMKRDEELSKVVQKHQDAKRSTPLIDLHKNKKAKTDQLDLSNARKPFDREEDLKVNKFDEAQKEIILKKARNLDDRFSAGNKKFL